MADPGLKSKVGATPGKLVFVAVLAVVLVSVIIVQSTTREEPPAPRENGDANGLSGTLVAEAGTRVPTAAPGSDDVLNRDLQRPTIALEEVLQHDPFAMPAALLPPAEPNSANMSRGSLDEDRQEAELQRQRELALTAIREQGVQMVFLGKEEQVAIIGNRRISVGDLLEGFRVTGIGSDGVTLSEQ